MGTNIARRDIPAPTPQIAASLSQQDLREHRTNLASEVRVVLSAYFQPHEAEDINAAQLAWWCDELQDWTREQVVWGLSDWNRNNPRLRPTPGDIVAILKRERGKKYAKSATPAPAPERKPIDASRAAEIMAEAGFRPKTFGDA